ncbi:hypothetical protein GB937_004158 [Aspergillus fischeri]|nr:hypothetical protein GB937_004158 [Aspergillus fischeri]
MVNPMRIQRSISVNHTIQDIGQENQYVDQTWQQVKELCFSIRREQREELARIASNFPRHLPMGSGVNGLVIELVIERMDTLDGVELNVQFLTLTLRMTTSIIMDNLPVNIPC